jgi:hypothetical protein
VDGAAEQEQLLQPLNKFLKFKMKSATLKHAPPQLPLGLTTKRIAILDPFQLKSILFETGTHRNIYPFI